MLIIKEQGTPKLNSITIVSENDKSVIYEIDLSTKYCEISFSADNEVWVGVSDSTFLEDDEDRTLLTQLAESKPEFEFFTGTCSRYTMRLVFVKRSVYESAVEDYSPSTTFLKEAA